MRTESDINKPRVVFFHRKPYTTGNYSVEFMFADLRHRLSDRIDAVVAESSHHSRGIVRRLYNLVEVVRRQGDVNIITGDIQYVALPMVKEKTILVVLDCGSLHEGSGLKRWIEEWVWFKLPIARSAQIVTISEFTRNEIIRITNCRPDKVAVIPVNISEEFTPHPVTTVSRKPVLLQVGQARNKNLVRIVEALQGLDIRLKIIGKISKESIELLERARIDYRNHYNLSTSALVAEYASSDLLVFASTYEGFGMPILEAQAVGRPVVTSNIASMPWVAGEAACLVDPYSVSSIREGIVRVLGDDRYRSDLVVRGFENVKRFRQDIIADKYYEIIMKTLRSH